MHPPNEYGSCSSTRASWRSGQERSCSGRRRGQCAPVIFWLVLRTGVMHVAFEVLDAEPPLSLRLYVRLPFGVAQGSTSQASRTLATC
jgi:hypothetical protein